MIIEKKNLNNEDFLFAYKKNDIYKISSKNYPKSKLYLSEEWVNNFIFAPPILILNNEEKFKDINGNVIEIEVRGERKHDKCYFKVKDISKGFEMPNLNQTLINSSSLYKSDLHYKKFNIKTNKKLLFLTYIGLLKVLFSSRIGCAEAFQLWSIDKLFTIQLGDEKDKKKLGLELVGIKAQTIKDVFKINNAKTPVVYLYSIGKANELLEGKYDNNDLLCKFGCTDDLPRRCNELDKYFNKEFNVKIELICFSIIETNYIFNAEKSIKQYFKSNTVKYNKCKELVIINQKDLGQIKQYYSMIQNSYISCYQELNNKIIQFEKDIIELNNKIIIKDKEIELLKEKHKNELQNKDIEILQNKIKFLELPK